MCLGIPARVVEIIDRSTHRGLVDIDGTHTEVNIGPVLTEAGGINVGDWVVVHVGRAMTKIDAEEAERTLRFIRELGSMFDDYEAQLNGDPSAIDVAYGGSPTPTRDWDNLAAAGSEVMVPEADPEAEPEAKVS